MADGELVADADAIGPVKRAEIACSDANPRDGFRCCRTGEQ
jgi:hypothetical protein